MNPGSAVPLAVPTAPLKPGQNCLARVAGGRRAVGEMVRPLVCPLGEPEVRASELSDRDRAVLELAGQTGVVSARQVERFAFPTCEGTALTAARRARRSLARLTEHGYLSRLERRLGGARAGSSSYLYQLGTKGKRALGQSGRGRTWEPGARFTDHCLAVAEVHVGLVEAERRGDCQGLHVWHEPETWRRFTTASGVETLKPDLLVELTTSDGWELRWWVEVDRATEHLPTVLGKCQLYERYWRSGREAEHHEVSRVLWSVPSQRRAEAVASAIGRSRNLTPDLFRVCTAETAVAVLTNNRHNQPTRGGTS